MSAEQAPKSKDSKNKEPEEALVAEGPQPGPISQWLTTEGL